MPSSSPGNQLLVQLASVARNVAFAGWIKSLRNNDGIVETIALAMFRAEYGNGTTWASLSTATKQMWLSRAQVALEVLVRKAGTETSRLLGIPVPKSR